MDLGEQVERYKQGQLTMTETWEFLDAVVDEWKRLQQQFSCGPHHVFPNTGGHCVCGAEYLLRREDRCGEGFHIFDGTTCKCGRYSNAGLTNANSTQ